MEQIREAVVDAILSGSLQRLRQLCETHGSRAVLLADELEELTALHIAAARNQSEIVRFLLSPPQSAEAGAKRVNSFTPLHSAAMNGHAEICEILLEAGADPNVQTVPQLYSPLHSASYGGHHRTIAILLRHGANPELRNYRGERPSETLDRAQRASIRPRPSFAWPLRSYWSAFRALSPLLQFLLVAVLLSMVLFVSVGIYYR